MTQIGHNRPFTNPHKAVAHPSFWVDAPWRDSYDAAGFLAIFNRANYSVGIGVNDSFCA